MSCRAWIAGVLCCLAGLCIACSTEIGTQRIPAVVGNGSCSEKVNSVSQCDWIRSVDEVIVGEIEAIEPNLVPVLVADNSAAVLQDSGECEGVLMAGLKLKMKVKLSYLGRVDVGSSIDVYLGARQSSRYYPSWYLDGSGTISWLGDNRSVGTPLVVGGDVGFAIYRTSDGLMWTIAYEKMFTVNGDSIKFQEVLNKCEEQPPALEETTLSYLGRLASEICSETAGPVALERRDEMMAGEDIAVYYAALCIPKDANEAECSTDTDCDSGLACIAGKCATN